MKKYIRGFLAGERGFSLIEVLVSIAILGTIAAGFLLAIAGAYKANILADERTTAESLARAQMEYVKAQSYVVVEDFNWPYELPGTPPPIEWGWAIPADPPAGFIISVDTAFVPGHTLDDGIQKIIITITHNDNQVLVLDGYKVDR